MLLCNTVSLPPSFISGGLLLTISYTCSDGVTVHLAEMCILVGIFEGIQPFLCLQVEAMVCVFQGLETPWNVGAHNASCHHLVSSTVPFHFAVSFFFSLFPFPFPLAFFTFALFSCSTSSLVLAEADMRMVSWSLWRTMGRRVGSQARGGSHQEDGMPDVMGNVFTCRDLRIGSPTCPSWHGSGGNWG